MMLGIALAVGVANRPGVESNEPPVLRKVSAIGFGDGSYNGIYIEDGEWNGKPAFKRGFFPNTRYIRWMGFDTWGMADEFGVQNYVSYDTTAALPWEVVGGWGATMGGEPGGVLVEGAIPECHEAPALSGPNFPPQINDFLECSTGVWDGEPDFEYAWYRQGDEEPLPGEIYASISCLGYLGHSLYCRVTGTNSVGPGAPVFTAQSGTIYEPVTAPVNVEPPTIYAPGSTPYVDMCEVVSLGVWSGQPPPDFYFQWFCNAVLTYLSGSSVFPESAGSWFCRITATNAGGSASADSNTVVYTDPVE